MLGLDTELKQTRFYQEIAEEERQGESIVLLTRLLRRKYSIQPELEIAQKRTPGYGAYDAGKPGGSLIGF